MDERLRQLEREAAQGDHGAAVRLLRERLRVGLLCEERLELGAYLGHEPALELRPMAGWYGVRLEDWLGGLIRWGRAIIVRGTLGLARLLTEELHREGGGTWLVHYAAGNAEPRGAVELRPDRPVRVGRANQADLQILDPTLSRMHLEARLQPDGSPVIRDLDSHNGTYYEGERIHGVRTVRGSSWIVVGNSYLALRRAAPTTRPWGRCIQAVEGWLKAPGDARARAVEAAVGILQTWIYGTPAQEVRPGHWAALAAGKALLNDPPALDHRLQDLPCGPAVRRAVRSELLPLALEGEPFTRAPEPPADRILSASKLPWSWADCRRAILATFGTRLERWIGGDSRKAILLARDPERGEPTVVTICPDQEEPRIWQQVQRWAQVEHPRLARVLNLGILRDPLDGVCAIQSELVPGATLRHWSPDAPPAPERVVDMGRGLCQAAAALLERLPRVDLNPDRIRATPDGRLVLVGVVESSWDDLLARHRPDHHQGPINITRLDALSPERIEDALRSDPRLDAVYQLGLALHVLLTGRFPFQGRTALKVLRQILQGPPRPSELAEVPAALEEVVLRAMTRDLKERYPDPLALDRALAELAL